MQAVLRSLGGLLKSDPMTWPDSTPPIIYFVEYSYRQLHVSGYDIKDLTATPHVSKVKFEFRGLYVENTRIKIYEFVDRE